MQFNPHYRYRDPFGPWTHNSNECYGIIGPNGDIIDCLIDLSQEELEVDTGGSVVEIRSGMIYGYTVENKAQTGFFSKSVSVPKDHFNYTVRIIRVYLNSETFKEYIIDPLSKADC